jgi:hypothetical protein
LDIDKQDSRYLLTPLELEAMENKSFLLTKADAMGKVSLLLKQTLDQLTAEVKNEPDKIWSEIETQSGKISHGENYLHFPYQVLDYPAHFDQTNILTLRTMFYWGNFFSVTLHLQGTCLDQFRDKLQVNFSRLLNQGIYIGVGAGPWQYHYGDDNYLLLQPEHIALIRTGKFVKLSKKIPLSDYLRLPDFTLDYFRLIGSVLS